LWRWKVYCLLLSAALSHGLFAEARTIPLSVDQILFSAGDEGAFVFGDEEPTSTPSASSKMVC
jgi:hypothetical protein